MAFLRSCISDAATLAPKEGERAILDYLLEHAVGKANLKSWDSIEAALTAQGITGLPSKESFQTGLLSRTRENDAFIGSTKDGYFIIEDMRDAFACLNFYLSRIEVENRRVQSLRRLMQSEFLRD